MPNNMISLSPLSTQNLVLFHLEDFSDTMGDVIEGWRGSPPQVTLFVTCSWNNILKPPEAVSGRQPIGLGNSWYQKPVPNINTSRVIHILPSVIDQRSHPVCIYFTEIILFFIHDPLRTDVYQLCLNCTRMITQVTMVDVRLVSIFQPDNSVYDQTQTKWSNLNSKFRTRRAGPCCRCTLYRTK